MIHETLKKFGFPRTLIKDYGNWCLLLRQEQITLGSMVLVCKESVTEFSKLSTESFLEYTKIIPEIESQLKTLFCYDKINHLMLMMIDPHVHFHIIPRYSNPKEFNKNRFYDNGWPLFPDFSSVSKLKENSFESLIDYLKSAFNSDCCNGTKKKYMRVYTSGVFDLFHPGHLNVLKRSKEIAEYLIVGVSTDELVKRVKNKTPVIPFEERKRIVESIRYVDEVIPQEDKNKQKIVDAYDINAITVGDDWKGKFPSVSCELVYFSYTPLTNSTKMRKDLSEDKIVDIP
jgi:glycerol-3-phosphate cytidylyltransferase